MPEHIFHQRGMKVDWTPAAIDYATHRPDYPAEFYSQLKHRGIGLPNQQILDLGTGPGVLARHFAHQGANVIGNDIAIGQIEQAKRLANEEGLSVDFRACNAHDLEIAASSLDVVTASQCWAYFDVEIMIKLLKRWLKPGGRLVTCQCRWLPKHSEIARATERLIIEQSPTWSGGGYLGDVPAIPGWAATRNDVTVVDRFQFDAAIPFTRESWRGRIRASGPLGATLSRPIVEAFDARHAATLEAMKVPNEFTIVHRIDAHLYRVSSGLR